jgi:integrase
MAARRRKDVDLTGVRQRGGKFQVRVFGGTDPVTGKQVILTGSADTQDAAVDLRDGFRKQVRERTAVRTNVTLGFLLDEWLAGHEVEATTRAGYVTYIDKFIRPALGDQTLGRLAQLGPRPYEQLYAQLRQCRRRCRGETLIEHRTPRNHECDERCAPHVCTPLSPSSIRQCHAVLSSAYSAAVRWGWIALNPMETAHKPRSTTPQPRPPSTEDAARIVAAAWEQDDDWGMLIWLTLVTGARRGELLALRWEDVDLAGGVLSIRHSLSERAGAAVLKDTKTHQMRRISLDEATVELLADHRKRTSAECDAIGATLDDECFLFSYAPDCRRPCSPSGVTHRYERLVKKLGIRTHLHAMRHYSATELLSSGTDLRTVAGRLGHGGGGAITLKVYAAWVQGADQEAARKLASRLPMPRRQLPADDL